MNSLTRFRNACLCQKVDRPPVWLMRQAGRYLPEYQLLRARHSFLDLLQTEELIVEISLQPWRALSMDAVIVFSDILLLPMTMGMDLKFLEGQGPKFSKLIENEKELQTLKTHHPKEDVPFLLSSLRQLKKELKEKAALIGFAGSPWTVASYITKNFERVKEENPSLLKKILTRITDETKIYLNAQIEAGVDCIQIFDSWGGILSASDYFSWSGIYIKEIIDYLKPRGVPIIIYVRDSKHLLNEMAKTGADVLSIGWESSLSDAKKVCKGKQAIQGNLNPHILMNATPEEIGLQTQNMLKEMNEYPGYIVNVGHGVLPKTPVENVRAFVKSCQQSALSYQLKK